MPLVIKYGGSAMTDAAIRQRVAATIHELQTAYQPIVIHGGGPFIKSALERSGISSSFVRGLRVTSPDSLEIIEQTLTSLNKMLTQEIGRAIGLTGRDAAVLQAETFDASLGLVGRVTQVNAQLLFALLEAGYTPVLACLASPESQQGILNVNADEVAGAVAGAMASPVIFLTDVPGVLDKPDDAESLLPTLSQAEIELRIADGRISGGMIPKVEAALQALSQGASYAIITDGRDPDKLHAAMQQQAGTRITHQ